MPPNRLPGLPGRSVPGSSNELGDSAAFVELRVTLVHLTRELDRLRSDLSGMTRLPSQVEALSELWTERLDSAVEARKRAVDELQKDVDELRQWQTWLLRAVVGAVLVAGLALVLAAPPPA